MPHVPKNSTPAPWIRRVKPGEIEKQYHTQRWRNYRRRFLSVHPTCARCGREANTVDHIEPARYRPELFWRASNHQALCSTCHNVKRATED